MLNVRIDRIRSVVASLMVGVAIHSTAHYKACRLLLHRVTWWRVLACFHYQVHGHEHEFSSGGASVGAKAATADLCFGSFCPLNANVRWPLARETTDETYTHNRRNKHNGRTIIQRSFLSLDVALNLVRFLGVCRQTDSRKRRSRKLAVMRVQHQDSPAETGGT